MKHEAENILSLGSHQINFWYFKNQWIRSTTGG